MKIPPDATVMDDKTVINVVRELYPASLDTLAILHEAMHITTILGEGQIATDDDGLGVFWYTISETVETMWICWLSARGVYISDDMAEQDQYHIIGYCVVQHIPYFTDSSVLSDWGNLGDRNTRADN